MKIVIAPDSFKESLSAVSVAACIEKGFREIFPDADYVTLPLADGGEGTVDVLLQGLAGQKRTHQVEGPLGHAPPSRNAASTPTSWPPSTSSATPPRRWSTSRRARVAATSSP